MAPNKNTNKQLWPLVYGWERLRTPSSYTGPDFPSSDWRHLIHCHLTGVRGILKDIEKKVEKRVGNMFSILYKWLKDRSEEIHFAAIFLYLYKKTHTHTQNSSVNTEISPKSVKVKIYCSSAYKINRLPLLLQYSHQYFRYSQLSCTTEQMNNHNFAMYSHCGNIILARKFTKRK